MFERGLHLPVAGTETFFLWGPRQTGKTTLLRETYRKAVWIDLLKAEEYRRYLEHPEWLRSELPENGDMPFVVIDEVQKVPQLLDDMEVAIEAKASRRISANHLKGLRQLRKDHPEVKKLVVVCCEEKPRRTEDGIEILPAQSFVRLLWENDFF